MNNLNNLMGQFQQFMSNPYGFLASRRINIPQEMLRNPNQAIQHLMNTGQLSQEQYNQVQNMARNIQNNPMFQQFFRR